MNANIANFVLAVSLQVNEANEVCKLEMQFFCTLSYLISHFLNSCSANKE